MQEVCLNLKSKTNNVFQIFNFIQTCFSSVFHQQIEKFQISKIVFKKSSPKKSDINKKKLKIRRQLEIKCM